MKTIDGSELTKQPNDVTEAPYKFDPSIFVAKEANVQVGLKFYFSRLTGLHSCMFASRPELPESSFC